MSKRKFYLRNRKQTVRALNKLHQVMAERLPDLPPPPAFDKLVHVERDLYAAPTDAIGKDGERLELSFNQAAEYAGEMNKKRYLGFTDWRVPTDGEMKLITQNKDKPGLADSLLLIEKTLAEFYWTSNPTGDYSACCWCPREEKRSSVAQGLPLSLRLVRRAS